MICHLCGIEAETRFVAFHQNIGALVVRFYKTVDGCLCKTCIHRCFWSMTTKTLFLGWWGIISLVFTPCFLLNNIGRYLLCIGMPPVRPGATRPRLTAESIERIRPHAEELHRRLEAGEKFAAVATLIARRAGVTPGQVTLFFHGLTEA